MAIIARWDALYNDYTMTSRDWLDKAITFDMGECRHYKRPIVIEAREQIKGPKLWVLKMHEWVLGKDGEFYREPMPSSRTDEFIQLTRFNSPQEAYSTWIKEVTYHKPLYMHGTKDKQPFK